MADWSFTASLALVIVQANVISNYSSGDCCISLGMPCSVIAYFFHYCMTTPR